MYENKRKGIRISIIIDELIDEISSLKPDEYDCFDISDVYNDVYELQMMSNKYCPTEEAVWNIIKHLVMLYYIKHLNIH